MAKRALKVEGETETTAAPQNAEAAPTASETSQLVKAIDQLAKKDKPKPIPKFGPPATDEDGEEIKPNCTFVERDGTRYDAVVNVDENGAPIGAEITMTEKQGQPDKWVKWTRKTYALRVNFKQKKNDNWKPVTGISEFKALRNNYEKRYVIFPATEPAKGE